MAKPTITTLKPRISVMPGRLEGLRTATVERKRGTTGVNDRNNIKRRDCGLCQECKRHGRTTLGTVVDHITPLWQGGSDDERNKELLCDPCHDVKTAREAGERAGRG